MSRGQRERQLFAVGSNCIRSMHRMSSWFPETMNKAFRVVRLGAIGIAAVGSLETTRSREVRMATRLSSILRTSHFRTLLMSRLVCSFSKKFMNIIITISDSLYQNYLKLIVIL